MQSLPAGQRPTFSMQDFFAENECEWFLEKYTETAYPIEHRMVAPAGLRKAFDWPRKLSRKVNRTSVRRWNQKYKRNYLEMAWDGLYHLHMFHKAPESKGIIKVPEDLHNLLNEEDENVSGSAQVFDDSIVGHSASTENDVCRNDSIIDLIEGQIEHERPFSDDELDPMVDDYAEDEVWFNAEWRGRLEKKLKKKIADAKEYNLMIKSDPTKKFFREREIDPYWTYLLKEIEYTNGHEQVLAANQDVKEKDNGIYSEKEEVMQKEPNPDSVEGTVESEDGPPSLEGSEVAEETSEVDLLNQGIAEIDSKDLEETEVAEVTTNVTRDDNSAESQSRSQGTTRNDTSDETESSEDDQIVVITGQEIANSLQNNVQNETGEPLNRRFDHLQFKARLKIFAEREPLKSIDKNNNKKLQN